MDAERALRRGPSRALIGAAALALVVVMGAGLWALGQVAPVAYVVLEGPEAAQVRYDLLRLSGLLDAYADENEGALPVGLDRFALPPATGGPPVSGHELLDPWGRPYRYELAEDGQSAVVACFGRDGEPGGSGADVDRDRCVPSR